MRMRWIIILAGIMLALAGTPAFAHHSFAAEYDSNKSATLKGAVTKMEWQNPHAGFYIDVKDETGKMTLAANRKIFAGSSDDGGPSK